MAVVCHALLQGIFPTQGSIEPGSPALQTDSLLLVLLYLPLKKNLRVSGPAQFKPVLFKVQLYLLK